MEQTTIVSPEETKPKQKGTKLRSIAYPSFTLESSLKMSTKVNNEFTSINYIPSDSISKFLDTRGGSFLMAMSSSVQYGLLILKKGEGYKPSELLSKILKPLPNENINDLLLECLMKPELYKKLFNDYKDKQLPSESGLANTLDRLYGVKGKAAETAAKVFFKNIRAANLISNDNVLKISSYISFIETQEDNVDLINVPSTTQTQLPIAAASTNTTLQTYNSDTEKAIPIFLKGNREAKVILPNDFSDDDLNRIVKILSAYVS